MASTRRTIVLTGGGTGGHIYPLVAVIEELNKAKQKPNIHVIVERGDKDSKSAFDSLGVTVHETPAGKLRRYHGRAKWYFFHPSNIAENLRDSYRLTRGVFTSRSLLKRIKPDVVFVKGGYVGLPVGLAAASMNIPMATHDSDVLPGITNRILSRWAEKLAVGFPIEFYDKYPARKLVHTGIPVRAEFGSGKSSKGNKRPKILIVGGSLGARFINQLVLGVGKQLLKVGGITHITGKSEYEAINSVTKEWQKEGRYKVYDFVKEEFPSFLKAADVVVCRAGATTLAECAVAGRPMIVVPNPNLTGGHQLRNGYVLEDSGAAIVLGEPQLSKSPEMLADSLEALLRDKDRIRWQCSNAKSLFPVDAAEKIAELLMRLT